MWYRVFPTLLLSLLVCTASGSADDRDKSGKTVPDKKATPIMLMYQGKIRSVDLDKRSLVLGEARPHRKATAEKDKKPASGAKDRDTRGNAPLQMLTFALTRDVRITLDGRAATLKDLKAGHFANIHAVRGTVSLDRRNAFVSVAADRKDRPAKVVMTANRVEASTKAFTANTGKRE